MTPRLTPLALIAAATLALPALAQPPAQEAPKAAATPAAAEAQAVLDRAMAVYGAAKSYSDKTTMKQKFVAKGPGGQPMDQSQSEKFDFVFSRTDGFASTGKMVSLFGNAKGYSISIKPLKQYVVVEGTKRADFDAAAGPFASLPLMSVPVQLLTELGAPTTKKVVDAGGKVTAAKFPVFTVVEGVKAEERSGVKGKRVSGRGALPGGEMMGIDEVVAASAWFADDTGLLGEVSYDLTEMLKKMMGGADAEGAPKIEAASLVLAHDEVKLDPKVDAAAVAFKAADGYKKVDKFSMEEGGEGDDGEAAQKALIGKPAPVVKAKDLDGKAVALADHKGKVVVLDFWATWCPPCVQSIPSVQGLWDGFKEKGVVVIGVNQDQEESVEKVKKFIAEKGVTYPQYADFVGELGELFHVTGIPCMVFIDKEGVVRDIHVGFTPGDEAGMKAKVEKLLKGEKLVEPAAPTQPAATPGEKPGDKPAEKK